ncbi:MAG: ferric reductase-like transmembrane domain-containing protein [Litoreibacter sp.]
MDRKPASRVRAALIWISICASIGVPLSAAALSPLLAWREPVYILAGFAGIVAMGLLFVQPLLAGGHLPGLVKRQGHRLIGGVLVAAVVIHVGALWLTSPPDVIDALTFSSPTPFSFWGVIAMWAVFASALLAMLRRRLRLRPKTWKFVHLVFAAIIAIGTVLHAQLIQGTMEAMSKAALSVLVITATIKIIIDAKLWTRPKR